MTTEEKIIKNKVGLLRLAETLGNVSHACRVRGYLRESIYRFKELYDEYGEEELREICRKKPKRKNRVEPGVGVKALHSNGHVISEGYLLWKAW